MAVEAHALVESILSFETLHVFVRGMRRKELNVFAVLAGVDAGDTLGTLVIRLGVECYTFQAFTAVMAAKALRVEADACCGYNTARDGKTTVLAKGARTADGRSPVRAYVACGVACEGGLGLRWIRERASRLCRTIDVD
jgi:hypothetical protein